MLRFTIVFVRLAFLTAVLAAVAISLPASRPGDAAFPGANGKICLSSYRDGNSEIYVMNADGSSQTNVTNNPANDGGCAWSPDGTRIAFASDRDDLGISFEIYVMDANGSNQTRVTNDPGVASPGGAGAFQPAWSPNGNQIVFVSTRNGGANAYDLFVINANGTGEAPRATIANVQEWSPAWAPDDSKIHYARHTHCCDKELWTMNPDGTGQTLLISYSTFGAQPSAPSWRADSLKFTFQADQPGSGYRVWVANANGSSPTVLTDPAPPSNNNPAWSPDGSKIAFSSSRDGQAEIYVMNSDGSLETRLTTNSASDDEPDWQPLVATPVPPTPTPFSPTAAPTPTPGPPTPIPPGPPVVGGIAGLADTPADPALAGASGPSTGDYAWPAAAAVALMTVVLGGAFVRRRRRD